MQVSVAGLRRNIKNIAHNYTEPQKKVREATSNDPWGPSSTLMSEIADLTYNIEAFAQIMEMLWKRLNDHGKNWRHVYKSLVLLEYLIKTGSERVAQQCKENIFAIQTLKDFQYFEDNKDQGMNVREKAKQLVTLLTSEERLRNERARALKARERFAQTVSGFGSSDSNETTPTSPVFSSAFGHGSGEMTNGHRSSRVNHELEQARPQTIGEEELQLQLALAMSKEEADQEEKRRRSDELKLQMALSQSEQEFKVGGPTPTTSPPRKENGNSSALVDLLDVDLGGAAGLEAQGAVGGDPWAPKGMNMNMSMNSSGGSGSGGAMGVSDPWSTHSSALTSPQDPWNPNGAGATATPPIADPWSTPNSNAPAPVKSADPWSPGASSLGMMEDEFDVISKRTEGNGNFNLDPLAPALLAPMNIGGGIGFNGNRSSNSTPDGLSSSWKKNPLDFLGENSNLVNLDNLVPPKPATQQNHLPLSLQANPFASVAPAVTTPTSLLSSAPQPVNPFHIQNAVAKPSINEIREKQQQINVGGGLGFGDIGMGGNGSVSPQGVGGRPAPVVNNPWSPQ